MKSNFIQLAEIPNMKRASNMLIIWNDNNYNKLDFHSFFFLLTQQLNLKPFILMNPSKYHFIDGVIVENNIASLPEIAFWSGNRKDLVILTASPPQFEWHDFLKSLITFSSTILNIKTIYIAGLVYKNISHKSEREITMVYSSPRIKKALSHFSFSEDFDYDASLAPGKPSISSYLAWLAEKHNVQAVNTWVSVPFYLSITGDPAAIKKLASVYEKILKIGFNINTFDKEIKSLNLNLKLLAEKSVDVAYIFDRIQDGDELSEEESQLLLNELRESFLMLDS